MQRDRARERNERARRQWELEHCEDMMEQNPSSPGGTPGSGTNGGTNGPTMNHIGSNDTIDGIPGYSLVSKVKKTYCFHYFSKIASSEPAYT
jgi:hypothetical protein